MSEGVGAAALNASIGIATALVIPAACYPPGIVRDRLGVIGIDTVTYPLVCP